LSTAKNEWNLVDKPAQTSVKLQNCLLNVIGRSLLKRKRSLIQWQSSGNPVAIQWQSSGNPVAMEWQWSGVW